MCYGAEMETLKKRLPFILVAVVFAVLSSFYFMFPSTTDIILKSGGAMALQAWNGTFGTSNDQYIVPGDDDLASDTVQDVPDVPSSDIGGADSPFPEEENNFVSATTTKSAKKNTATSIAKATVTESSTDEDAGSIETTDDSDIADGPTANASPYDVPAIAISSAVATTSSPSTTTSPPPVCAIVTPSVASKEIILNEIAWMGTPLVAGETATQASEHEWIELKNNSSQTINLSDWQLFDRSGVVKIIFSESDTIGPDGYFLLARNANDIEGVTADKNYSGGLSNAGDVLTLFDAQCGVADFLDASAGWPAGNNTTKQTLERDADGIGWHTSVPSGGTPRAPNSDPAPEIGDQGNVVINLLPPSVGTITTEPPAQVSTTIASSCPPDHLVIAAIMIAGASTTNDFVKIFNPTAGVVDISGWKLRKKSSTGTDSSLRVFPDGSLIAPGGDFLWANSAGGFGDTIGANATSSETLAADNSVALEDASGTIIDAVAWGTGSAQYVEGNAFPTDPTTNQVLVRNVLNGAIVDTDNNASDFTLQSQ
jgi:hypothetical protein